MIIGIIGGVLTFYLVLIGLNVYGMQHHKMQLEQVLPRVVEQALEEGYCTKDEECVKEILETDIREGLSNVDKVQIEILALDLEKGLLSVAVTETFSLVNGEKKTINYEKTAIMDRLTMVEDRATITFLVEEEVYKEYQLTKGETCPVPNLPSDSFSGWMQYGSDSLELITYIGPVWTDMVYIAVAK